MDEHLKATIRWDAQILLLTWTAGTVDAIGYLGLGHVFTANMTGNAVLLGLSLGQGQALAAYRALIALAGFIIGAAAGAMLVHRRGISVGIGRALFWPVLAEAIILSFFALGLHLSVFGRSQSTIFLLIVLSAIAMGIQSAAIQHLHLPGIATTVVTGTITSLVVGFIRRMRPAHGGPYSDKSAEASNLRDRQLGLQAGVFVVYLIAATASGVFQQRLPWVVGMSALVAIWLVLLDTIWPAGSSAIASS